MFKTGGAGGQNYALHDTTNDFMVSLAVSSFMANNASTILVALTVPAGWANGEVIFREASSNWDIRVVTGNLITYRNFDTNYDTTAGQAFVDGTPLIYACKHIGGNIYDSKNGGAWSSPVASGNCTVTGLLQVGATGALLMHMYGLAMANVEISDADLALNVNYFKQQLGIA